MTTQAERAADFAALHAAPGAFVAPNPWDPGSARILAALGFPALTTTSSGFARSIGIADHAPGRAAVLDHVRAIAAAVELPISADLENGFGRDPETVAETIRLGAECGLVGGSIEDASGSKDKPIFDFEHAVERVAAAAEVAKRIPSGFVLTARTENFLRGRPDLDDTIRRLQAFEKAGADVLMAPGLPDLAAVRAVCAALRKPVNFMAGIKGKSFPVRELEAAGVRRVSLATSLYRAAMSGLIDAAREVRDQGSFDYLERSLTTPELNAYMQP